MTDRNQTIAMPPVFSKDNLPGDVTTWEAFRRVDATLAVRVNEPFAVAIHGVVHHMPEGGWVAIDSEGDPYPISDVVFENSYVPYVAEAVSPA